ncbi:MAG: cell division protein FtsQ/DivIB [Thermoleophilia bacterium]|nr:cell division protein FtsQ/DivIB [Thermoleophilia bacterium]
MLRIAAYVSVVTVASVLLILWTISGPVLGISDVTVKGYTGDYRAEVQQSAELVAGTGSMVRLPSGDMRTALTRFPGVLDTDIERDWPWSITVRVTMGAPIAILSVKGGRRYLISPSGQVMGKAGNRAGLPVITVASYPQSGVLTANGQRAALRFIGWLPPDIAGRLRDLHAVGGGLEAKLNNGLELRLGAATKLAEKAQALVAVLSQADPKALDRAAYLDLSNPSRPMLGSTIQRLAVPGTTDGTATDGTSTTDSTSGDATSTDGTSNGGMVDTTGGTGTTLNP